MENYNEKRTAVINKIKETHDWEETEGFIADGLIAPEIYAKEKLKISCFLGESYGYAKSGMVDIETQLKSNILGVGHYRRHTSTKIPALLWLIYQSNQRGTKIDWKEFPWLLRSNKGNTTLLQEALAKSAWINVKKASKNIQNWGNNATRQDYWEVYKHGKRNKEVLKLQIESLVSDVMIICSDPVFNSLFDMKLLGEGIKKNQKYKLQTNSKGQKIIQVNHPGYLRDWGYKGIYKIFEMIYDGLSN